MADTKISALSAGSALAGTEEIPVVQSAATVKTTPAAIKTYIETGGTVTASDPVLDLTQTWNNVAVPFTAVKVNVTNTASAAASLLQDWQIGGVTKTRIDKDGYHYATGYFGSTLFSGIVPGGATLELRAQNSTLMTLNGSASTIFAAAAASLGFSDAFLTRDAAGILAQRNGVNAQTFRVYDTYTDASNYGRLALNAGAAGDWVQIAAETAGTGADNYGIALTPRGTGAISAHVPDSTAAGGNARGANAVDWQTDSWNAARVASGDYSVISGGSNGTASASYSTVSGGNFNTASGMQSVVAGGNANTASGVSSWVPGGQQATTRGLSGAGAYSSGQRAAQGDAQVILQPVRQTTAATTTVNLTTDAAAVSTTNCMVLPINSGCQFEGRLTAVHAAGAAVGGWKVEGIARRGASGAATVVDVVVTAFTADAAIGAPTITVVGTAGGAIVFEVTPANATTTYWVGRLELIQAA